MIWAPFQQGRGVQERGDRLGLVLFSTILDDFSRYVIAWKLARR
jgi:hypothetical protein